MLSALLGIATERRLDNRALGRLAAELARALDVPALTVRLLDPTSRWLDLKASVGLSSRMRTRLRRIPVDSLVGVVRDGRSLVPSDETGPSLPPWPAALIRRFGAGAFVPIRSGTAVLGALGIGYRDQVRPSTSQLRFLDIFGRQLGTALQAVRTREARRKAQAETRFLRKITAALSTNLELRAVLDMVTSAASRLTRARGAVVLLASRDATELEVASASEYDRQFITLGRRFPLAGSLSGRVIRTGRSARSRDLVTDPRPMLRELQRMVDVRGVLIIPLRGADRIIGTLAVSSRKPRLFSNHDRRILMELGHQASIAIQNARLFDAVQSHRQLLRQLYSQQFAVVEGERKRIAHELHDEMGPTLSAILINLQLFKEQRPDPAALSAKVVEVERLLTGIIEKVRELAYGLRPPMLEHLGLAESVRWMIDTYFSGGRLSVNYRHEGTAAKLDPELALAIYRIAQEALTNVVKHARADRVTVRLRLSPSQVSLRVRDDGCGFDPQHLSERSGLGLASMRERTEQLHGRMEIRSAAAKGCDLTVACPVEVRDASAAG
jgi:signal transduction histidine kinase